VTVNRSVTGPDLSSGVGLAGAVEVSPSSPFLGGASLFTGGVQVMSAKRAKQFRRWARTHARVEAQQRAYEIEKANRRHRRRALLAGLVAAVAALAFSTLGA
jgi:hypothetical protein